ncbi:MAG: hypothetical protein KGY50_01300 [Candidatus Thermoplasmatota archaeon]|nr:hypothetical protein [Candidatus Thermoplasmatota archaeon]
MNKKLLSLLLTGLLFLGGFQVFASVQDSKTLHETITLSSIDISETDSYTKLSLTDTTILTSEYQKPMLPKITKTMILPFGSTLQDISVTFSNTEIITIDKPIQPAGNAVPVSTQKVENTQETVVQYDQSTVYPKQQFEYHLSSGIKDNTQVLFLSISLYPVQYTPSESRISVSNTIDLQVTYYPPEEQPATNVDTYELLVIAPTEFNDALQPLIDHKNSVGMDALLKTTDEIYAEFDGVDKPEQIKYCIKDAFDNAEIKYVLLVGGLNSMISATARDDKNQGTTDWFVPVRYANIITEHDPGLISDLYYADLYDGNGNFSSWDTNNDGVFASYKRFDPHKDDLDLVPEVAVGRLACRSVEEVNVLVDKIITYETTAFGSDWFNNFVLIGGDTFADSDNYVEGELENQKAFDYVSDKGFNPVKVWASNKDTGGLVPVTDDIVTAISDGCGLLLFAGHGSPEIWNTHWVGGPFERSERVEGIWWFDMPKLSNEEKLPITVVGGCHNSQFNVTLLSFVDYWVNKLYEITGIESFKRFEGSVYTPLPECFSWFLVRQPNGGSIATIGNTGTGYGYTGNSGDLDGDGVDDPDCLEKYGGYLETLFYRSYGQKNSEYLGSAWQEAITDYLLVYPPMKSQTDAKTIEQWVLLGDPSLKIGGYE